MRADRDSVRRKLKIARGQLDGILQMIDDDRYCVDISNQILATPVSYTHLTLPTNSLV